MAKKLKKFLKKAGKAAAVAAALYGATKLGRKRATDAPGDAAAAAKKLLTSNRAYTGGTYEDPIMTGGVGVKQGFLPKWSGDQRMVDPDPRIYRKGGGIAKRGMGAAFKSGGRVKSMGAAKRGGGAAKR